jgi:Subtilase family
MKTWLLEVWRWLLALLGRLFMAEPKDPQPNPGQTPGQTPPTGEPGRTLPWDKPGVGSFSGIDYSKPENARDLDGYFVWADLNGFAHLRGPGQKPGDDSHIPPAVPVLVELAPGVTAADIVGVRTTHLEVAPVYLKRSAPEGDEGDVVPAIAARGFFEQFAGEEQLRAVIARVELDIPRAALLTRTDAPKQQQQQQSNTQAATVRDPVAQANETLADYKAAPAVSASTAPATAARPKLCGKVIAFIDDGCAFAHPHFLTGNPAQPNTLAARVKRLWDQNPAAPGAPLPPTGFVAGREFTDSDLLTLVKRHIHHGRVEEEAVYAEFAQGTQDKVNRLNRRMAHGTHIMDLACGPRLLQDTMCTVQQPALGASPVKTPSWNAAGDDASTADIIFVQLPMQTVQDTSGSGSMASDVLQALDYIMGECDDDAKVVVNLSWGTLAGAHTGSSVLERGIDLRIKQHKPRLQVVIPAGNAYQTRAHANFCLEPNKDLTLHWRVQPDDATESYVELFTEDHGRLQVTITLPDGSTLAPITRGSINTYSRPFNAPTPITGVTYMPPVPPQKDESVLIAIAPTVSMTATRNTAPHGLWKIKVKNTGNKKTVVDAYIERDDVALGTKRGARQSYFEDPAYDIEAKVDDKKRSFYSNPPNAYVRREGTFNSMATGKRPTVVGGQRQSDLDFAEYSPRSVYSPRPKREGTPEFKEKQLHYAISEESRTLHGVRAAGTRGGGTVRLSGTSDAAPQVARELFNAL